MSKRRITSGKTVFAESQPALIDNKRTITFAEYHRAVSSTVEWLRGRGVKPEMRVGIRSQNSIEYIVALMAVIRSGAVACPLNVRFPAKRLSRLLTSISCDKVITSGNFESALSEIDSIELPELATPEKVSVEPSAPDPERDATIIFTSGSESIPKAVLHTYGNHYYNALGSNENIELKSGDRWLLSLPLYHVGGLGIVFRCLLAGAAVVVPEKDETVADAVRKFDITHLSLVPTQLRMFLQNLPPIDRLRCVLVGGSHIPGELIREAVESDLPIRTTYGSTEAASQIATTSADDPLEKLITSGRCLNYRQLGVAADGELLVKGRTLFKGYVTSSGLERPFDADGWYHTGDIGHIDDDGFTTVTGRKDNMFISGGENIYPEEVEAVIRAIEGVEEVVVVPIDDAQFGRRPVAFVRVASGSNLSDEEILMALSRSLPRYQMPDRILGWPEDAKSDGMKLDRGYFRNLARQMPN